MSKSFEKFVLGAVAVGLTIVAAYVMGLDNNPEHGTYAKKTEWEGDDIDYIKHLIERSYKEANRKTIPEQYRHDVYHGIFTRNAEYIEMNANFDDEDELHDYNSELYCANA